MEKRSNNITELMMAASKGDLPQVQSLLTEGAAVDEQDRFGNTALIYAAGAGHLEIVRLLLTSGADQSIQNKVGMTALMRASSNGHDEVVQLLERGASQVKQFPVGQRELADSHAADQLLQAVRQGNLRQARSLISSGVNVNARTRDGQTALHIATTKGDLNMMDLLLRSGVDVDAANNSGWTALWQAVS
ncbi:MAG TPA: ankyrin repeat domain-containing protein, partial [Pyrinomonadaceae bacterium]